MEEKILRKYNSEFRKNLKTKISKITNNSDYVNIYKIINNELQNKLSINRNGIYFNLNLLSDNSIEEIFKIIEKTDSDTCTQTESKMIYETYNKNESIDTFITNYKLTNQEKSLIKKFKHTKI